MREGLEVAERLFAEGEAFANEQADEEPLSLFRAAWAALPESRAKQEPSASCP